MGEIVLQHHERMDGKGYPQGLWGDKIYPEARVLAVADVVEAMLSHRPYRPAWNKEKVLQYLKQQSGNLYDSKVVRVCGAFCKRQV